MTDSAYNRNVHTLVACFRAVINMEQKSNLHHTDEHMIQSAADLYSKHYGDRALPVALDKEGDSLLKDVFLEMAGLLATDVRRGRGSHVDRAFSMATGLYYQAVALKVITPPTPDSH